MIDTEERYAFVVEFHYPDGKQRGVNYLPIETKEGDELIAADLKTKMTVIGRTCKRSCLWHDVECIYLSKFKKNEKGECNNYAYYD